MSEAFHSRVRIAGAPAEGKLQRLVRYGDTYDHGDVEKELVGEARKLVNLYPDIGALVLECTQMPPFAEAIQQALGDIPVYDVFTMGSWFYQRLVRKRPQAWGPHL